MECCICYENNGIYSTKCLHQICLDCLVQLKDTNCPYCRTDLKLPDKIKYIIKKNNIKNIDLISNNHRSVLNDIKNISIVQYNEIVQNINNGYVYEIEYLKELLEDIVREKSNMYRLSSLNWWEM